MPSQPQDPNRALAALAQRGLVLELSTVDLCFVAALYVRAQRGAIASFEEDQLIDVFEQVCETLSPEAEQPKKRATHAIRRLREQRMLARIDGAGVLRAGEYALTRLATGIVEFYLEEESLTRESLTLLTRTLLLSLAEALAAAQRAVTPEAWQTDVVGPLRVTVLELVSGIERRQRGFDLEQEDFQREIAALLQADWFGAVERCQHLLEATSATLSELNQILLRDTHQLQALLHEIQELAATQNLISAEEAARSVSEQVDRIAAWGSARQRAWSDYYQYVHRYLRDVVRLDPARTLTQRLREQLAGKAGKRFTLSLAMAPPMRLLRPIEGRHERPPVRRPKKEKEAELQETSAHDPQAELELRVKAVLDTGLVDLSGVTKQLGAELPANEQFVLAGRVAEAVARLAQPSGKAERPWVQVQDNLRIEEWKIAQAGGKHE